MKYKPISNVVLVFILIYILMAFSTPVAAASATVSVDSVSAVQPGGDFTTKINLADVIDFDAAQYDITYNPAVIQVTSVSAGQVNGTTIPISQWGDITSGVTRVIHNVPNAPGVSGSGYLAEIHFHVVGAAGTSSAISLHDGILGDKDTNEIPAIWTDGTVQVAAISTPSSGGGGGGGGGGGTAEKRFFGLMSSIGQDGTVWENVEAQSTDSRLLLEIPISTVAKNKNGAFLSSVTVTTLKETNASQEYQELISAAYDLGPAGATFDPSITLTIKYDASLILEGVSEDNLFIAYWDENKMEWVPVNSTLNEEEDNITTLISHFSTYTVMANTRPASFILSELSVVPAEVRPADKAVINVKVANNGDLQGSYEVVLLVNGIAVENRPVTLAGRTSQEVNFTYTPLEAGSYNIKIGSLTSTFRALAPVAETEPVPTLLPEPARFILSDLSVTPAVVTLGEQVTISAVVTNTGGIEGSYIITLKINDTEAAKKEVALKAGKSERVDFLFAKDTVGSYKVNLNDRIGQFDVSIPQATLPEQAVTLPVKPPPDDNKLPLGVISAGGVIIMGLLAYYFLKLRKHSTLRP